MGDFLSTPNREKHSETGEGGNLRYVACGMQGWRRSMEDSHIAYINMDGSGVSLFGVFDGHGGQEVALFVKKHFKEELVKLPSYKTKRYQTALTECFYKMDEMMLTDKGRTELSNFQDANNNDLDSYAGCTSTVVIITRTEIICANAGDSRTVMASRGIAKDLSVDHKPEDPVELQRIENSGNFVDQGRVNGRLALSRALGDFEFKQNSSLPLKDQAVTAFPDIKVEPINVDTQFVLLACDGIWDVLTSQETITYIHRTAYKDKFKTHRRTINELQKGVESLLDDCCANDLHESEGIGTDNMTAILVEIAH